MTSFDKISSIVGPLSLGPCCPWSVTLEASAAVLKKWPQYFGQYTPTGKRYHRAPVYINKQGRYLFVNKKGAWSANNVLNERGVLRGTDRKNGKGGKCVASITDWKLWDNHEWRSANITASCVQGIQLDVNFFYKHQSTFYIPPCPQYK